MSEQIDFTEIPSSRGGFKGQDRFEEFAAAFLEGVGMEITRGPNRGSDDGVDILVTEFGPETKAPTVWAVSCKHLAHSDGSVGLNQEKDIVDRVDASGADGFLGFYSTSISSGLQRKLEKLLEEKKIRHFAVYDRGHIAQRLLNDENLGSVMREYLPKSSLIVNGLRNDSRLELLAGIGYFSKGPWDGHISTPPVLDETKPGLLKIKDGNLESMFAAGFIVSQLAAGNSGVLDPIISFEPEVWQVIRLLLDENRVSSEFFSEEISRTRDPMKCRLLISLAGEANAVGAADQICHQLLTRGRGHNRYIIDSGYLITPFFDVCRHTLCCFRPKPVKVLTTYRGRAKQLRRWKEKEIFDYALRKSTSPVEA